MFLVNRGATKKDHVPVQAVELSALEKARQDFDQASQLVESKHKEICDKETLFKRLLAEAPQDAYHFDSLQRDLAQKKKELARFGGI